MKLSHLPRDGDVQVGHLPPPMYTKGDSFYPPRASRRSGGRRRRPAARPTSRL